MNYNVKYLGTVPARLQCPLSPDSFPLTLWESGTTDVVRKEGREMARRCLVEGCGQFVRAGKVVCREHGKTVFGRVVTEEVARLVEELRAMEEAGRDVASRRAAVREFRRRVERGEYAALFAGRLREVVGEASRGPGFEEEREALRVALWRVMGDERVDAIRLAHAVSRLVGTTVRAARADLAGRKAGGMEERDRLAELLAVLGGEEVGVR